MFKQFDHEGGIHTPMIAHWPKGILEPGRTVNQVSHLVDIMPTLLDITQLEHPRTIKDRQSIDMDGVSLKSYFSGQKANVPRELYFHHASGRAIREGDWKLVQVTRGKWELYNLKKDPNELINLAAKMPGRVDQLKTKFRSWENLREIENGDEYLSPLNMTELGERDGGTDA